MLAQFFHIKSLQTDFLLPITFSNSLINAFVTKQSTDIQQRDCMLLWHPPLLQLSDLESMCLETIVTNGSPLFNCGAA